MKKLFQKIYEWILWFRDVAIFGQWTKFWDFLKLAHSSSDEASSKRLYGGLIVINCVVVFDLFSKGIFPIANWEAVYAAWYAMLLIGSGMISLSVVEKIAEIIANIKITRIDKTPQPPQTPPTQAT